MLSLYRKFPLGTASIRHPEKTHSEGFTMHLNERRELVCERPLSSFVIAEDVYVYFADNKAIWYSKAEDLSHGRDIVYRVDMNNIFNRKKGFINADGLFFYIEDGNLYREDELGNPLKLCAFESLEPFFSPDKPKKALGVKEIENFLCEESNLHEHSDAKFYEELNELHALVSLLAKERESDSATSYISAKIIAQVMKTCCKMNKTFSGPLSRIIKEEIF